MADEVDTFVRVGDVVKVKCEVAPHQAKAMMLTTGQVH